MTSSYYYCASRYKFLFALNEVCLSKLQLMANQEFDAFISLLSPLKSTMDICSVKGEKDENGKAFLNSGLALNNS